MLLHLAISDKLMLRDIRLGDAVGIALFHNRVVCPSPVRCLDKIYKPDVETSSLPCRSPSTSSQLEHLPLYSKAISDEAWAIQSENVHNALPYFQALLRCWLRLYWRTGLLLCAWIRHAIDY